MPTFLFTTDNSTAFVIVDGKDEENAQAMAEQAITTLPGVKLQTRQAIDHSLIVNLSITKLSKAKSDDVLVRRLLDRFKDPKVKIELENEPHADGSLRKKILVDGKPEILLDLKNPEQIADFEANGLGDQYMEVLHKRLEGLLKKPAGVQPEILTAENGDGTAPKAKKTKGKTTPPKEPKPHAEKS
jgi:hypothetical protein